MWLEERRKHDLLSQSLRVLIHREARTVAGDLEQDTVRLAEVEAAEPVTIHLPAIGDTQFFEPCGPGVVFLKGRCTERDVMDAARALLRDGKVGLLGDVN